MRMKCFLTAMLLAVVMTASAQVQVFTHNEGHGAICREKKLFMMEAGDETPIWNIVNYKKNGNKETFTLTPKEETDETYSCVMTLDGNTPTAMTLTSKRGGKKSYKLKLTNDGHLNSYYGGLCGYPAAGVTSGAKGVGDAAKNAFGKVKGLFGKKKDKK